MTLSLYSTCKALQRDSEQERKAASHPVKPVRSLVYQALAMFGIGMEGLSCGGDDASRDAR
ncbi:MAG: hypothetical protein P4L70_07505 [Parasulfuritortus sp.]|nr:hypothetical protein [Parasulfuritortus sp.]